MNASTSPAAQGFEQEKARESAGPNDSELEIELEGTFPASDPALSTTTAIPAGSQEPRPRESASDTEAPLVDQALSSVAKNPSAGALVFPDNELESLHAEIAQLRISVSDVGVASVRIARAKAEDVLDDARASIIARPLTAVGTAALLGYIWGRIR